MQDPAYTPYVPLGVPKPVARDVWIVDGPEIRFGSFGLTFPFPTRMTIVHLPDGRLWVHSPTEPSDAVVRHVRDLGPVAFLVAPNTLHYWWIPDWKDRFPEAEIYAVPGLERSLPRQPQDLAGWPERHGKVDRLVDPAADADLGVEALEPDPVPARALQDVAHGVRSGHREGSRPAVHLIGVLVRHHRHDRANAQLRLVEPGVVLASPPHDHRELAARCRDIDGDLAGLADDVGARDRNGRAFSLPCVYPQRRGANPKNQESDEYFPHGPRLYRQLV